MKWQLILLLVPWVGICASAQQEDPPQPRSFEVTTGTRIPLGLINSISTKQAVEGDRVYLESVFPILVDGKIVIPPGSYVAGTVTQARRAGRIKGRSELFIRFDSLTLPNGVTRDFRARVGGLDGRASEELDRSEGKIKGEGNKGGDVRTVPMPEPYPTNICFGGPDLRTAYITLSTTGRLVAMDWPVPGAPLNWLNAGATVPPAI